MYILYKETGAALHFERWVIKVINVTINMNTLIKVSPIYLFFISAA